MDPTPIIERELAVLDEVLSVLDAEAQALRELNYQNIDLAAQAKLELDERLATLQAERAGLSGPISDEIKQRYRERMQVVRAKVDANNRRLEITGKTISGLIRQLTGAEAQGYGRRGYKTGPSRAVLTSTVG